MGSGITDRASTEIAGTEWGINEFNDTSYMLVAKFKNGTQFHVHFDSDQWAAFQHAVMCVGGVAKL